MFSFFRKIKNDKTPQWASFFDSNEYNFFIKEVGLYFTSHSIAYEIDQNVVVLDKKKFEYNRLGLLNVAQKCKLGSTDNYASIIEDHFNSLIRSNEFDKEFQYLINNFGQVKKYICVRLYNKDYVSQVGEENLIIKDFAGDIVQILVFDFPDSIRNIQPSEAVSWNKTTEELFELGVTNFLENYPWEVTKEKFGDLNIWFVQSSHFFTANIVFEIENQSDMIGSYGSLIGLPHRHTAIIYPIENIEVLKAIHSLIPAVHGMNHEGPGSLSNNLFWYKDGLYTSLPYKIENEKLQFIPPDNFLELLNELS